MITMVPEAREHLRSLGVGPDLFLRLGVEGGGCSGLAYTACLDNEKEEGDVVLLDEDDIRVVTDQKSSLYLAGVAIEYSDDLIKGGLRLINKSASGSCGCGGSFTP